MPLNPLQAVSFLGPILFGIALAVALRLLPRISRWETPDLLREALSLLSWILIAVGLAAGMVPLGGGLSGLVVPIFPLIIGVIVLVMSFQRWRLANQYGFIWAMATAAEQGIPLISAIDAFAEDRRQFGGRARRLAELLRAGWSLPDALTQVRGRLPREDLLMIRVGYEAGALTRAPATDGSRCRIAADDLGRHGGQARLLARLAGVHHGHVAVYDDQDRACVHANLRGFRGEPSAGDDVEVRC